MIFMAIAIFLVIYSWTPARQSLQTEEGRVLNIRPQPNTWFEVEIMTSSGIRLTCRTRRGWPLVGPTRCPLEKFEPYLGMPIRIAHDGKRPYEITAGHQTILDYSVHRQLQAISISLAGFMLLMAALVWRQ